MKTYSCMFLLCVAGAGCSSGFSATGKKPTPSGEAGDAGEGGRPVKPVNMAGGEAGQPEETGGHADQAGGPASGTGGSNIAGAGGSAGLSGGLGSFAGGGQAGMPGAAGTSTACLGTTEVGYQTPVPNILVMVDRSHKAAQPITTGSSLSPWEITREALITSGTGVFSKYQGRVNFSLAIFAGPEDGIIGDPATTDYLETSECPHVTRATFGVNNFLAISQVYKPSELGSAAKGWAPFPESYESILPAFASLEGPKTVVAILSKNPNGCDEPWDEALALDRALGDIEAAYADGITSYFVGIGTGLGVTEVAQPMANVGQGYPKTSEVNLSYQTTSGSQLVDALEDIMGRQVSCRIELDHTVLTDGRDGTITIDGIKSFQGTGWQLTGEREIEFVGASCDQLKAAVDHEIEVSFPCGSVEE